MKSITKNARRGGGEGGKLLRDNGQLSAAVNSMAPVLDAPNGVTLAVRGGRRSAGGNITIGELAKIHNGSLTDFIQANLLIKPTNGRFLCMPTTPEAKKYKGAREFMEKFSGAGARFIFVGKGRGLIIRPKTKTSRKKANKGEKITVANEIHFICVESVSLPRRRFLGMYPELSDKLVSIMDQEYYRPLAEDMGDGGTTLGGTGSVIL